MKYNRSNIKEVVEEKLDSFGGQMTLIRAISNLDKENENNKLAESLGMKDKEFLELLISEDFIIVSNNRKNEIEYRPLVKGKNECYSFRFLNINQAIMYGIMLKNDTTHMYGAVCKLTGEDD